MHAFISVSSVRSIPSWLPATIGPYPTDGASLRMLGRHFFIVFHYTPLQIAALFHPMRFLWSTNLS
jgi:hypothetical protein